MELRRFLRVPVQCSIAYLSTSAKTAIAGKGTVVNLSREGLAVEATEPVKPGMSLALKVHLPDHEEPILVGRATVCWSNGKTFGLKSNSLSDPVRNRLCKFIRDHQQFSAPVTHPEREIDYEHVSKSLTQFVSSERDLVSGPLPGHSDRRAPD